MTNEERHLSSVDESDSDRPLGFGHWSLGFDWDLAPW